MENMITLKNAKFVGNTLQDGSKQFIGLVQGDSFINTDIPTDPNPRQFISEANSNYKDMVHTLKTEPGMFARKNSGGITLFASSMDSNGDGSYTVKFKKGDGIANGGHTYNALRLFGRDTSFVKVTVEVGLDKERIVEIARALNLNKKLQTHTLYHKEGSYDWHKEAIGDKANDINYFEGDSGVVGIKESIAFLNLFRYDLDTREIPILDNIRKSEESTTTLLKMVSRESEDSEEFISSLKWVAKDVHTLMMETLFDERMVLELRPYRKLGQAWVKSRGADKVPGMVKGLGILLLSGLAEVGTKLNDADIVRWKEGYDTHEARSKFISSLFERVLPIVTSEEGTVSQVIRLDGVRKRTIRVANILASEIK